MFMLTYGVRFLVNPKLREMLADEWLWAIAMLGAVSGHSVGTGEYTYAVVWGALLVALLVLYLRRDDNDSHAA